MDTSVVHIGKGGTIQAGTIEAPYEEDVVYGPEANLQEHYDNCHKNPKHEQFIPVTLFGPQHLPAHYHKKSMLELIKTLADLTVRLTVNHVSNNRPETYNEAPYPRFKNRGQNGLSSYGSGRVVQVNKYTVTDGEFCPCSDCKQNSPVQEWSQIRITTATHVVFDDAEAQFTNVRWGYDSDSSQELSFWGISAQGDMEGDVCNLFCVTHDLDFADSLAAIVAKYKRLSQKVFKKYESTKDEEKLAIIVSHPHGCPKQVSVGQWTKKTDIVKQELVMRYVNSEQDDNYDYNDNQGDINEELLENDDEQHNDDEMNIDDNMDIYDNMDIDDYHDQNNDDDRNDDYGDQHNDDDRNDDYGDQHNNDDRNDDYGDQHNDDDRNDDYGDHYNNDDRNNDDYDDQYNDDERNDDYGDQHNDGDRNDDYGDQHNDDDRNDDYGDHYNNDDRNNDDYDDQYNDDERNDDYGDQHNDDDRYDDYDDQHNDGDRNDDYGDQHNDDERNDDYGDQHNDDDRSYDYNDQYNDDDGNNDDYDDQNNNDDGNNDDYDDQYNDDDATYSVQQLVNSHTCSKYIYTACTCPGTSGATVFLLGRDDWTTDHLHSQGTADGNCSGYAFKQDL